MFTDLGFNSTVMCSHHNKENTYCMYSQQIGLMRENQFDHLTVSINLFFFMNSIFLWTKSLNLHIASLNTQKRARRGSDELCLTYPLLSLFITN